MDNYSEDDDDSYSSEQEASDDAVQAQVRADCQLYDQRNTWEENGCGPAASFLNKNLRGFMWVV